MVLLQNQLMMAPINPWLAALIETELDHIITWKSILKPDPDASEDSRSRLSDDGSNFRSVVGSLSLDSESAVQLLEKPGSNARAKISISDGDVSILATLSDAAWDAYDEGLEAGEEARKGDLILCKKITIVSTTYGPSEERVKLRIEDLELTGNFRKVVGSPAPLLQRTSILSSLRKIEDLRLKQLNSGSHAQGDEAEDVVAIKQEEIEPEDEAEASNDDDQADINAGDVSGQPSDTLGTTVPALQTLPETPLRHSSNEPHTSLRHRTPPTVPSATAGAQIESQLPQEISQTQLPPQIRNPLRRSRGGFSMGREGFEPTRGDNLTGPQAPTLHARQARSPVEPPRNKLLDVISKLPGQAPRQLSPEPSAPISAQVATEDIVVETPTKGKRSTETSTAQESTPAPRKRYRIPRDQKSLLDSSSSWIPSAPGQQFPHPNVPIGLLKNWNARAAGATKPLLQSSPIPTLERSSGVKSVEEVRPEPEADTAAEPDSESEASFTSEDEPIDWSPSPSRSQVLPPDSSAAHSPVRTSRPSSLNLASSDPERASIPQADDAHTGPSGAENSIASKQRVSQGFDRTTASQSPKEMTLGNRSSREHLASTLGQRIHCPAKTPVRTTLDQSTGMPSSSVRSPALQSYSRETSVPGYRTATQPTTGKKPTPLVSRSSQLTSNGLKRAHPADDSFNTPVRPSTQQAFSQRHSSLNPRNDVLVPNSTSTPPGAPTGPRASTGPRYTKQSYQNRNMGSSQDRRPPGDFYRPSSSGSRGRMSPANGNHVERQQIGGSKTPSSTIEMESAVPRPLPTSKYHEERSKFYRDAQRRKWLDLNLPADITDGISIPALLHAYKETYPSDPVTERDIGLLISELRPNFDNTNGFSVVPTGLDPQSRLAVQATGNQALVSRGGNSVIREDDRGLETHPNDVITEFVSAWKVIRPGGAWSHESAAIRPQRRALNVLSWGFGE